MANNEAEIVALGLQQFADQAKRLGITWSLHQGTISGDINEMHSVFATGVTLDGDASPITVNSIIGQLVGGTRVFVLFVPPSGAYVIGRLDTSDEDQPPVIFNNVTINGLLTINGLVHATNPIMKRVSDEQTGNLNGVGNVAYEPGATVCGFVFTAPPSGIGMMHWHGRTAVLAIANSYVSIEIREGSTLGAGTVFFTPNDDFAVLGGSQVLGTGNFGSGTHKYVSGLVPGFDYNVTVQHRVSAATANILSRYVTWEPEW